MKTKKSTFLRITILSKINKFKSINVGLIVWRMRVQKLTPAHVPTLLPKIQKIKNSNLWIFLVADLWPMAHTLLVLAVRT